MPIRAERRHLYPPDWREISRAIRYDRAGGVCEFCGIARNGLPHPVTGSKVVLTVAHLTHDETCADWADLAAMCQRCHLTYDATHHRDNAARTRRSRMSQMDLVDLIDRIS